MTGIPFIGQNGFVPAWAKGSGRWVFQRTLVSVEGIHAGLAELVALSVPASNQVIIWAPSSWSSLRSLIHSELIRERDRALSELGQFHLICYGNDCSLNITTHRTLRGLIEERGLRPVQWRLL